MGTFVTVLCQILFLSLPVRGSDDFAEEGPNQLCSTGAQSNNVLEFEMIYNRCNEESPNADGLKLVKLSSNVTCNDGTPAGFYIRKSETNSKKWIVYLEGGWYCYDEESCRERWERVPYLMSSAHWPSYRTGLGILSNNPNDNPYWWHANHVFVPYCTSDIWSGRRQTRLFGGSFTFMGSLVVKHVIKELLPMGLKTSNSLMLAGSSAGGVGVMLNLEPVQKMLTRYGVKAKLKGITDSGWFLDQPPFMPDSNTLTPVQAVKQGFAFWRSQVPHSCKTAYPGELWKCFIGYRIYPTLSAPLFVFQWLFDEVQMKMENIGTPVTREQWEYIHSMGEILKNSLQNVTSVFAPSCISHSILSKKDWHHIRIDNIPLPDALHCWERGIKTRTVENAFDSESNRQTHEYQTVKPLRSGDSLRRKKRRDWKCDKSKKRNCWRNRLLRSSDPCSHRLIERCSWPMCNHYCPKLQNPFTGEELDLLQLLTSFGLDMKNVAAALGVDINTLNNMEHRELISMLTQEVK